MITLSAHEAGGILRTGPLRADVTGVSIDSRRVSEGDLFIALRGERHDGHHFVDEALSRGAAGAVVSQDWLASSRSDRGARGQDPCSGRLYGVPDTLTALGELARAVRRHSRATVIAVTGSVGKTGTKDLIRAMAGSVARVAATAENQNNEIGVPLTLLGLGADTDVAVVEMGMRGPGQIAALAALAEPDVGVVTNVAPVHLELLGTVEAVARAKAELLRGVAADGVGVIPAGSPLLEREAAGATVPLVRFSAVPMSTPAAASEADVVLRYTGDGESLSRIEVSWPQGEVEVEVPWSGRARMENAAAACAACLGGNLPLERAVVGLREAGFSRLRGEELETRTGIVVVNDSYNSNPVAVQAALEGLGDRARVRGGRAVAVLGDMLELGREARRFHEEVGRLAYEHGVRMLVGVGSLSRATVESFENEVGSGPEGERRTLWVEDADEVLEDLEQLLRPGDVVLVKGSRGMRLERVPAFLMRADGSGSDGPSG